MGVLLDAAVFEKGPEESLVRFYPVDLPLVGKHQALQGTVVPLGDKDGLPGVFQHGQQGGTVLILLQRGTLPGGGGFLRWGSQGQAELVQQGEQLQPHHQGAGLLGISLPLHIVGQGLVNGGVPADGAQVVTQKGVVPGFLQFGLHGGLDVQLLQMVVDILDAAKFLDELPGSLGTDPRHPGDAVGGIPLDGLQVDHLGRSYAVIFLDFRHIVQGHLGLAELGGGQAHGGGVGHQLQAVPVPGGDQALASLLLAGGGKGSQNVVGLPALAGDNLIAQIHEQFLEHRQLLGQLLRHALAVGLVAGVGLVPEGGSLPVKGDGHPVGGRLVQQLFQHGEKPVNAVGVLPIFGGQHLDAVKGPV